MAVHHLKSAKHQQKQKLYSQQCRNSPIGNCKQKKAKLGRTDDPIGAQADDKFTATRVAVADRCMEFQLMYPGQLVP